MCLNLNYWLIAPTGQVPTHEPQSMQVPSSQTDFPSSSKESAQAYINRLENLEKIANGFEGVSNAFAIQAGREIRVLVNPEHVDDLTCVKLARDIRDKIESELTYPGQIKVNVIRETRAQEYAK